MMCIHLQYKCENMDMCTYRYTFKILHSGQRRQYRYLLYNVCCFTEILSTDKTDNLTCEIIYDNFTCENYRFSIIFILFILKIQYRY